jgi:hypothetical protein
VWGESDPEEVEPAYREESADCDRIRTNLGALRRVMNEWSAFYRLQDKTREALELLRPWVLKLARRLEREKRLEGDQLHRWWVRSRCPRFAGKSVLRSPMRIGP